MKQVLMKKQQKKLILKIKSGEDYILSVRVNKNCFLTDSEIKNNIDEANVDDTPQIEYILHNEDGKSINSQGSIKKEKNINTIQQQLSPQPEQKHKKKVNFNINSITITKKSVINKMQERHGLVNNHLNTESPMPLPEIYQKSIGNKQLQKGVSINDDNKSETNTIISYRDFNEENIKIYYITPVLLY